MENINQLAINRKIDVIAPVIKAMIETGKLKFSINGNAFTEELHLNLNVSMDGEPIYTTSCQISLPTSRFAERTEIDYRINDIRNEMHAVLSECIKG